MSRVIFFIRPMHGHVNPTLGLVTELVQRGEEVIYYTTETFREKIRETGAVCRFYVDAASRLNRGAEPDAEPDENNTSGIDPQQRIENLFADLATRMKDVNTQDRDLYEEVKAQEPDYIVYDYIDAYWGKRLAQKLHVPALANINTFALCEKIVRKDPQNFIRYVLNMSPHEPPFKDNAVPLQDFLAFISSRIGSTYNLANFSLLDYGSSELLNIVHTSRYFHPYGELFDGTFLFIGGHFNNGMETMDFPLEKLEAKPIIYISLGTNFNRRQDFYKNCIEAFKDSGKQVILSVGNRIDLAALGNIPNNIIVRPFVPQREILAKAGLFITHGGINSVGEGIHYHVPLMVFPQHGDQFAVGHQVQSLGAGICFQHSRITPAELRETAEKLYCNQSVRDNCLKISVSFEESGGVKRAVEEIFNLKQQIGIH